MQDIQRHMLINNRHAYLIMAHTNINQLMVLLDLIDDKRNDIFLHIDKKTKHISKKEIKKHVSKGQLIFVRRKRINWGGDSQIKLEIRLLKKATKTHHSYYHLISGQDLPLKNQNQIYDFFEENNGFDFVKTEIENIFDLNNDISYRMKYYYFFQNYIKRGNDKAFLARLQQKILVIQDKLRINRLKKATLKFRKGPNWFSITHDTACNILKKYKEVESTFKYTFCADEIFLQTILFENNHNEKVINDDLRFIDWERGKPYTFTLEDFDLLMNSKKIFARKFDINKDKQIIDKIHDKLLCK